LRTARNESPNFWAREPESENNDGAGAAREAAADAEFVTKISDFGENATLTDQFRRTACPK
jgi:hypothetical protein